MKKSLTNLTCLFAAASLAPAALAVDPPPDGGYPNQNTAESEDALFSLTTGVNNSATGFDALYDNTMGVREAVCSLLAGTAHAGQPVGAFLGLSEFFDVPTMRQWKRWLPCVIPI